MRKVLSVLLVCVIAVACLGGCRAVLSSVLNNSGDTYRDYVQSVLDLNYKGIATKYVELVQVDTDEANELYESNIDAYAEYLMEYFDVDTELVNQAVYDDYADLAKKIMAKAKYTVAEPEKSGDTYFVKVSVEPMDFLLIAESPALSFIETFNDGYDFTGYDNWGVEENTLYENAYAEGMYDVIEPLVDKIKYKDAVSVICEIEYDEDNKYGVSDTTWADIDDNILAIE